MFKVEPDNILTVKEHAKPKQIIYIARKESTWGGKVILPNDERKIFYDVDLLPLITQIIAKLGGVRNDYQVEWAKQGLLEKAGEVEE